MGTKIKDKTMDLVKRKHLKTLLDGIDHKSNSDKQKAANLFSYGIFPDLHLSNLNEDQILFHAYRYAVFYDLVDFLPRHIKARSKNLHKGLFFFDTVGDTILYASILFARQQGFWYNDKTRDSHKDFFQECFQKALEFMKKGCVEHNPNGIDADGLLLPTGRLEYLRPENFTNAMFEGLYDYMHNRRANPELDFLLSKQTR